MNKRHYNFINKNNKNGNTVLIVHNAISSFVSNCLGFSAQLSYIRVKTKTYDYRTGRSQNQIKSHGLSFALMCYHNQD